MEEMILLLVMLVRKGSEETAAILESSERFEGSYDLCIIHDI